MTSNTCENYNRVHLDICFAKLSYHETFLKKITEGSLADALKRKELLLQLKIIDKYVFYINTKLSQTHTIVLTS